MFRAEENYSNQRGEQMSSSKPMPVVLGYQTMRLDSSPDSVENDRRILQAYARREGYELRTVFTEIGHGGQLSAFHALLDAIGRGGVAAVVVPSLDDLGRMPRVREAMRSRLEREGQVPVIVAQSLTERVVQPDGGQQ